MEPLDRKMKERRCRSIPHLSDSRIRNGATESPKRARRGDLSFVMQL